MEQIGRHKTKYILPHTSSWSANQTTDARVPPDAYWKYIQRSNQDTIDKSTRRHQCSVPEPTVSYYSSTNSYKNSLKPNAYPYLMHPKHSSALHAEAPQRYQQITAKSVRNKDRTNNIAVINKDQYKTRQEDENNTEYIDEELANFTEDNLEEEEAENNRSFGNGKRIGESINKEYDEQEADDEIDEESDAFVETQEIQRNAIKRDAFLRAQQMRTINQQHDPHRIRYSQQAPKLYQAYYLPTRYYHNTPDHNIHETLSEEDLYTVPLKNSPRRLLMGYRQNWIPRRSSDRYDTMTSLSQPSGRPRTRSEMKPFTEAEFVDRRKCSRCGNISARKPSTSRRNNCRFQDNRNFSTKGRFGDNSEILDQSWCDHCIALKSRRFRDSNIPMHEILAEKYPMDEISHEFARMPSRYIKDQPNTLRDRTRHSAQTAQGANRSPAHYNP